jgi:hypothetical protein
MRPMITKDDMNTSDTATRDERELAARREERQGWLLLVAIFGGGAVLVALASMV